MEATGVKFVTAGSLAGQGYYVPNAEYWRLKQRADLAESYYILGQMPDRYLGWPRERDLWMKAYEATIPPDALPDWPEGWDVL